MSTNTTLLLEEEWRDYVEEKGDKPRNQKNQWKTRAGKRRKPIKEAQKINSRDDGQAKMDVASLILCPLQPGHNTLSNTTWHREDEFGQSLEFLLQCCASSITQVVSLVRGGNATEAVSQMLRLLTIRRVVEFLLQKAPLKVSPATYVCRVCEVCWSVQTLLVTSYQTTLTEGVATGASFAAKLSTKSAIALFTSSGHSSWGQWPALMQTAVACSIRCSKAKARPLASFKGSCKSDVIRTQVSRSDFVFKIE